ncbi:MAG: dihydroxyacetone kinase subunit DhaL [Propioniciclava sp.]
MSDFAETVHLHADMLTDLDRQIGDADHGSNMDRGMKAVAALDPGDFADPGAYLKKAGMTLVSTVGGASGPLYGTLLLRMGGAWPASAEITPGEFGVVLQAGYDGIVARGKANEGDKTMVDAFAPALRAYGDTAGEGIGPALKAAAVAAAQGRDATIAMVAHKGRASYLGERSVGHQDPGATSLALLFDAAARTLG